MRHMPPVLAAAVLLGASQEPAGPIDWMVGHWLSCSGGREVSETWTGSGRLLVGSGITLRPGAEPSFEWMRIGPGSQGSLSFYASPNGAPVTEFALMSQGDTSLVFSNPAHDFPQRVLYSRTGDVLTGAIEGTMNGQERRMTWTYRRAQLGEHCP